MKKKKKDCRTQSGTTAETSRRLPYRRSVPKGRVKKIGAVKKIG